MKKYKVIQEADEATGKPGVLASLLSECATLGLAPLLLQHGFWLGTTDQALLVVNLVC